mmetsp:Transcript_10401/g.31993  ORF Transcript_10401/g.31993 Transcript_10401/m.31993 type:complete len:154 (+) Transcript_10401:173-634(+)
MRHSAALLLCCAATNAFVSPRAATRRPLAARRATESDDELAVYGAGGCAASLVVLYSEFTLKTTGCGLPAGPFGLVGAAEGISYLAIIGIAGASLATKAKTGSGLPAGPAGLLGAAEGLAFLAIVSGFAVLGFQLADYGYIPNAVPIEGGVCS